jgi:hypothetical protein
MTGVILLEKLVPLIPPTYANLNRIHGVFAPTSRLRAQVVPRPTTRTTPTTEQTTTSSASSPPPTTEQTTPSSSPPPSQKPTPTPTPTRSNHHIDWAALFRIEGFSTETSRRIANELRAAGFVDADGFLSEDGDVIGQFVFENPSEFPTIVSQTESLGGIRAQVKAMRAEHAMYADFTARHIAWFDRFITGP